MIHTVHETGSTNADVAERLKAGEPFAEGDWLIAERQSAGRGRQGRLWSDGHGNFMGSTAIALRSGDPPAGTLALMAGLSVYEAVLPFVGAPMALQLKWPNDLLLGGAKLAGVLLEREADWVTVGIGVNLSLAPKIAGRDTICLADQGPAPDVAVFSARMAEVFAAQVLKWRTYGLDPLYSAWLAAAHKVGTPLSVHGMLGERHDGTFDGIEADGALRLRLANGTLRVIHAGDVMLERK